MRIELEDKILILDEAKKNNTEVEFIEGEEIPLVKFGKVIEKDDFKLVSEVLKKYWL